MILNTRPSFKKSLLASLLTIILYSITWPVVMMLIRYSNTLVLAKTIASYIVPLILLILLTFILSVAVPIVVIRFFFDTEGRWGWAGGIYIITLFFTTFFLNIVTFVVSLFIGGFSAIAVLLTSLFQ